MLFGLIQVWESSYDNTKPLPAKIKKFLWFENGPWKWTFTEIVQNQARTCGTAATKKHRRGNATRSRKLRSRPTVHSVSPCTTLLVRMADNSGYTMWVTTSPETERATSITAIEQPMSSDIAKLAAVHLPKTHPIAAVANPKVTDTAVIQTIETSPLLHPLLTH